MAKLGAQALTDPELLAIFLRVGIKGKSAVALAEDLVARFGGDLLALVEAPISALASVSGIGPAKAAQLKAITEFTRRALARNLDHKDLMSSTETVRRWLQFNLGHLDHEVFALMLLDSQNRLLRYEPLFRGTLTQASVYPREVVKLALAYNAAAVILAHNHPSGVAEPSRADELLTQTLKQALSLVDVKVLDHFIVGSTQTISFAERGLL